MKKLFLTTVGIIFCVLIVSAQVNSNNNSQAEANNANTLKVYNAIETGDVSDLDFIDPNIVDHAGPNGDIKGIDAVKNMFRDMHDHISNIKFQPIANATGGDYHFNLVRVTGTTNSDYMGMPANTPMDMTMVNVVRLENGKTVEHWRYIDAKDMHMNMGHNMPMNNAPDSTK